MNKATTNGPLGQSQDSVRAGLDRRAAEWRETATMDLLVRTNMRELEAMGEAVRLSDIERVYCGDDPAQWTDPRTAAARAAWHVSSSAGLNRPEGSAPTGGSEVKPLVSKEGRE